MKVRFILLLLLAGTAAIVACQRDEEPAPLLLDKGDLYRIKERGEIHAQRSSSDYRSLQAQRSEYRNAT